MKTIRALILGICLAAPLAFGDSGEPILPIESQQSPVTDKVLLGAKLFHENKLSKNNTVSCSSCHNLDKMGVDGLATSVGINGVVGAVNAPSVFNSSLNFRQFWNGRAKNLEEQVREPVENPKEMDSNWELIISKLSKDPNYPALFHKAYGAGPSKENIINAIVSFEKILLTPNSKFDLYLKGKETLSDLEKMGYQRFKTYGCVACHQGVNVGGNMYQTMGVMGNYFKDRKAPVTEADFGRYMVTKNEDDKFVFRVPSLRNVELTAPYFHDGSAKTLNEAVKTMAKYQLGRRLSDDEVNSIVAFLKSLTGELPKDLAPLLKKISQ